MNAVIPMKPCKPGKRHKWKGTGKTVLVGGRQVEEKKCEHCGQVDPINTDQPVATNPGEGQSPSGPRPLG